MEILTNDLKNQLNLLLSKKFISIDVNVDMKYHINFILSDIKKFASKHKDFLILISSETIEYELFFDELLNLINNLKNKVKIVQTTAANNYPYAAHPFVHLYLWKTYRIRLSYKENEKDTYVEMFPTNLYDFKPIFERKKTIKSILSMSRDTDIRDELVSKIDKNSISIFRYNTEYGNESIHWNDLINEYKNTYIAFVSETNYGERMFNCFTEKTILSFLTGNIPIILGQKHLIKDLKKLGFWIANDDFGFKDGDEYSNNSSYRVDRYVDCINNVSKMNIEDVKKYYMDNLEKIYNNWEIVSTIFNYPKIKTI
jgi:hypothetical protein